VVTSRQDSIRIANKLRQISEKRRSPDKHAPPIVLSDYLAESQVLAAYEDYKRTGVANLENFQPRLHDDDDDIPAELMGHDVIEIMDDDEASDPVCLSPSLVNFVDDDFVKKEVIEVSDSESDDEVLANRKTKRNHDDGDSDESPTKIFAGIFSINHILPFLLLGDAQLSNNNNNNNNSNNNNVNNSRYVVPSSIDVPVVNSDAQSKGPVRLKLPTKILAGIFSINHILPFSLLGDAQLSNNNNNNNNSNNNNANNSRYVVPSSIDVPPVVNSDAQSQGPVRLKLLSPGSTTPGMSCS
jgi:hypothetical protein